jgi:hypothetical protein
MVTVIAADVTGEAMEGSHSTAGRHRADIEFADLGELQIADETAPTRVWAVSGLRSGVKVL